MTVKETNCYRCDNLLTDGTYRGLCYGCAVYLGKVTAE